MWLFVGSLGTRGQTEIDSELLMSKRARRLEVESGKMAGMDAVF